MCNKLQGMNGQYDKAVELSVEATSGSNAPSGAKLDEARAAVLNLTALCDKYQAARQ